VEEMKPLLPFLGGKVAWEENGYYTTEEKLGASPFHAAGLFYSQEPSAMCAAPLLEVKPGERVLDLCSAPGGKGTQLACAMNGKGLIVLNEPISSRAKILSQNVERMGIKNAVVLNEYPETLAKRFAGYFDKILVDAPCSGEGMFRKNSEEALAEWSEENVAMCAERQASILDCATEMLKKGGRLVYSTCTFAYAEDEGQVCDYLQKHPEMRLIKQEKLYPHKVKGEGHFAALFEKTEKTGEWDSRIKTAKNSVTQKSERAYRDFEKAFFHEKFAFRLFENNGVLYELPEEVFDWKGLNILRVGIRLGEVKNDRFEPAHSLVACVKASECKRALNLPFADNRVEQYLHGEMIEGDIPNGWCLVCVDGYPLGLGKAVNGSIKNHLPKGIRKVK
jgi:NOL1/NOP2/fmu family ribosome biogenesis protein/precorrin-6B methylase 2